MIVLTVMLVAVFALLFGFLVGFSFQPNYKSKAKIIKKEQADSELQKEYENFLNYDGTAQQ